MLFLSFFSSQKCRRFILNQIFTKLRWNSKNYLWAQQSYGYANHFPIVTRKAYFAYWLTVLLFCFIWYTVHLDRSSYTDFNNMNTIFVTYFVSVTLVKCCIQMKGYTQYCLDGFFWAFRSWPNPGTTIPTRECETRWSPVWIRYINPQVSNWKKRHMCQCVGIQSCPWPVGWLRLWDTMVFQTHESNR